MAKVIAIDRETVSLADYAYDEIKRRIFDFGLMPGERFSESELAQQINVSRTPLRQALQRLQHGGFVEAIPKVGWLIPSLDFEKFDELYEFRVLIECHAARALCTDEKRRVILHKLSRAWQVPSRERLQDPDKIGPLDEAFHCQMVECTGNGEMARTYREITERMRIIRRLDFYQPERIAATYDEHAGILAALQKGRGDEAQRLLRAHIEHSRIEVRKITLGMLYQARERSGAVRSTIRQSPSDDR
ncbi:MAG: GntR family transcriptional regulator [Betaproteobacteria bacterium]|nr:GntR family transcriptional regulator [Betaproteobacteria bacterium]